ncbi:hypothetical protein TSUD_08130 [Trifolium subterraneum]|nr:hypothetical protein TSUD_08130 [Trifolium subterraneum]
MVLNGKWDEVEKYLSGFMNVEDDKYSIKIYFELRKQKYLEALDSNDGGKALDILRKDLKVFSSKDENLYKEMTQLLTINNIREHGSLSAYQDAISARKKVMDDIREIIEKHPMLHGKLKFPPIQTAAPEQGIFMNHVHVHPCRPSNFASINHGTDMNNVGIPNEIVKLAYTFAGNGIIALTSKGAHPLWVWPHAANDLDSKATTQVCPQLWHPKSNLEFMRNDLKQSNGEDSVSCFAISKRDAYLISTSGGMTNLFNMGTFKVLTTILQPPPMVTYLAFYPEDNNQIVVGFDDSSITIINVHDNDQAQIKLEGHSKRVTSFAFSNTLNVLVSADASAQWDPKFSTVINQATFSSNGQMVYASFGDGSLAIFDASNFRMHYMIHPSIYLSISSLKIYPTAIAAHPQKPNQFAAGFTDGSVCVFEPKEPNGNWIMP